MTSAQFHAPYNSNYCIIFSTYYYTIPHSYALSLPVNMEVKNKLKFDIKLQELHYYIPILDVKEMIV